MNLTPSQSALLGYMEGQSEARWCAGWLSHLDEALQGDPAYDWLVQQAGGTWHHADDTDRRLPPEERVNGRDLIWVPLVNKDWAFAVYEGNITEVHRFYTRQEAKTEADRLRKVKGVSH